MRNVIAMLHNVTPDSLVLLDEMGAGTDPQEGSALARALISRLLELGAIVIATTHYSELKAYAYQTAGVENASVEFDVQTLAPTYRLMIGVPGRSNALAIAKRLGMPQEIVDRAASLLDPDELRADSLLQDIRLRRDESERVLARARATEKEAEQLRRLASKELREAEIQRQSAREEALAKAEADLDEVRQTLRRMQRDRAVGVTPKEEVEQHRLDAEQAAATVRTFRRERVARPPQQQVARIRPGDRVEIVSLSQEAEVLSIEDDTAELQLGSLKLRQPIDGLRRIGRAKQAVQERAVFRAAPSAFVPMEIDLRGQRVAEIEPELEQYLQSAYLGGLPYVRIIHGKGTGALRQVVRDLLKRAPQVVKFETAEQNQGGDGATVAYMRED
jgi:DNA mismatch repair protein MutS2